MLDKSFSTASLQVLFGLSLGLGPSTSHFTQSSPFCNKCSYRRSLFCNTMSSIPNLSVSSLLGNLCFIISAH